MPIESKTVAWLSELMYKEVSLLIQEIIVLT